MVFCCVLYLFGYVDRILYSYVYTVLLVLYNTVCIVFCICCSIYILYMYIYVYLCSIVFRKILFGISAVVWSLHVWLVFE